MTITLKKYNNALYMFLIECIIPFRHKIELINQLFLELIENISFSQNTLVKVAYLTK